MAAPSVYASTCYGSVNNGRIEHAVPLPLKGPNFVAYSNSPITAGRQFVHATVVNIMLDAYEALQLSQPETVFMYGETGLERGGPFAPHRTHQNGLSVDFFMPVRDLQGRPVLLPTALNNRFGYDIEFDVGGRYANYRIDFPALAEYLYQLHRAAEARGVGMALVILDPAYVSKLMASARGPYLRRHINFMRAKPWVRHDEHFHVDFHLDCEPL